MGFRVMNGAVRGACFAQKGATAMNQLQRENICRLRSDGFGYTTIANKLGLSKDSVKAYCRGIGLAGVRAVKDSDAADVWFCKQCGKEIEQTPKRKLKKFCCDACRVTWWNAHPEMVKQKALYTFTCAHCGTPFTVYGDSTRKYCSHHCYILDRFGDKWKDE